MKAFGPDEQIVHELKEFKMKNRIEETLETIFNERDDSEATQVQYSIINFEHMT